VAEMTNAKKRFQQLVVGYCMWDILFAST